MVVNFRLASFLNRLNWFDQFKKCQTVVNYHSVGVSEQLWDA